MKHPHHDVIVAWAADTSRVLQYRPPLHDTWQDWRFDSSPHWVLDYEWRIKPDAMEVALKEELEKKEDFLPVSFSEGFKRGWQRAKETA